MKPGLAILPLEVWADVSEHPLITRQMLAQIADNNGDPNFTEKLQKLLHHGQYRTHTLHYLQISSETSLEPSKGKYPLRKRKIPYRRALLAIGHGYESENGGFRWTTSRKKCEFPEDEMPKNVKTFKQLLISYLDDDVLHFLDKLKPLFTNVHLNVEVYLPEDMRIFLGHLLPMIGGFRKISFPHDSTEVLEQHFPGTMERAQELDLSMAQPKFIPIYMKWLNAPQNADQHGPRFLKIAAGPITIFAILGTILNQFKEATIPASFVVYLQFYHDQHHTRPEEATIGNATTKEQLSIRNAVFQEPVIDYHYVEILRYPTGTGGEMREWVKQRAYYESNLNESFNEAEQMIWIASPTFGRFTKKAGAMDQGKRGDKSADVDKDDEAGPSTSTKKLVK